ncbi:sensor histidine kinase [Actinoallomurus sp. CA-142502]|uniref:sensor histidine kinase n=1 Tax=Actinoallomurus sp. CA-142502 TaxID=3239885 RepID=UPI003D8E4562
MRASLLAALERRPRPRLWLGFLVMALCLTVETLAGVGLARVAPVDSLSLLYLIGLLLITSLWGLAMGLVMAVASALVFDYFLLPPTWELTLAKGEDLVVLGIFLVLALTVCALARAARLLPGEMEARQEADLSAELARLLLRAPDLSVALPATARRLASGLKLPSASIDPGDLPAEDGGLSFPLRGDGIHAALRVPGGLPRPVTRRLRDRIVPSLGILLEAACEREHAAGALRASRDELARSVEEQAALRRLATLVAHHPPATEVFDSVAGELGRLLGVRHTLVVRYEPDGTATTVGDWHAREDIRPTFPTGSRWTLEEGSVTEMVARTGAPARLNDYDGEGALIRQVGARGVRSAVGCPIVVGRSLWGMLAVASSTPEPLPEDTEVRMMEFTELAAAAIANAQSNADLKASRARVVAAADEARRRIERDLHDGTQQRLVALGLEMRGVEAAIPPELHDARLRIAHAAKDLDEAVVELQEMSRGLYPAILAKGGLEPALMVLARRSPVAVELDVSLDERLPRQCEMTVYYVVSEALTNTAKHAFASAVCVSLAGRNNTIHLTVRDDGVGGADPSRGSGLIGLTDRVEAIGGTISIVSPKGAGTTVVVEIPLG